MLINKAVVKILMAHIWGIVLAFFILFILNIVNNLLNSLIVSGIVCVISYVCLIYSEGHKVAIKDCKSYSEVKPYRSRGVIIGFIASIPSFILLALYYVYFFTNHIYWWTETANGFWMQYVFPWFNFTYRVWMSPFITLVPVSDNQYWLPLIVFTIIPFFLPMFSGLGYIAGIKKFYLIEEVRKLFKKMPKIKDF